MCFGWLCSIVLAILSSLLSSVLCLSKRCRNLYRDVRVILTLFSSFACFTMSPVGVLCALKSGIVFGVSRNYLLCVYRLVFFQPTATRDHFSVFVFIFHVFSKSLSGRLSHDSGAVASKVPFEVTACVASSL